MTRKLDFEALEGQLMIARRESQEGFELATRLRRLQEYWKIGVDGFESLLAEYEELLTLAEAVLRRACGTYSEKRASVDRAALQALAKFVADRGTGGENDDGDRSDWV